jgi:hypothetical protein
MTATCPDGHASEWGDFCSVCGVGMGGNSPVAAAQPCPACGEPTREGERFCEACGLELGAAASAPAASRGGQWEILVAVDPARRSLEDPDDPGVVLVEHRRTVAVIGERVTIGRYSRSRGLSPDVDLSEPPADLGVSHLHAFLDLTVDGTWWVTDCSSLNGTYVNDQPDPLAPGVAVEVSPGDRIHVGAWTTLAISRVSNSPSGGNSG